MPAEISIISWQLREVVDFIAGDFKFQFTCVS